MLNKAKIKLEFPQILEKIAAKTTCEMGHHAVFQLPFITSQIPLAAELQRVKDMAMILTEFGCQSFFGEPGLLARISTARPGEDFIEGVELYRLSRAVESLDTLRRSLHKKKVESILRQIPDTESLIELSKKIRRSLGEEGDVLDTASELLQTIRRDLTRKRIAIENRLRKILSRLIKDKHSIEEIVTTRSERYVLTIVAGRWNTSEYILHDRSSSGMTLYVEPVSILPLNNEIAELRLQERTEIYRILQELTLAVLAEREPLTEAVRANGTMDVLQARARFVAESSWSVPAISTNTRYSLKNAAHPGLKKAIPIELSFGDEVQHVVISGANAGGKTVTLKTFGLFSLMFQSGIPIPCDPDSTIPIFDSILVDIGDSQSIVDDLSTFSAHIVNVKAIIEELVKPDFCLVLLDELGVGSNPRQGGALACAILEHLHDSNVLTLITTHYEPLIALASKLPRANNCAVRFDPEKVKPLYQLEMGRSGISHSFKIARLYGMEDQILDRALSFLDDEEQRFIRLSEMLEMKEKALNVQQKQLELSEAKTEEMKKQFKEEVELLRKRREEARGEVVKELEKELSGRLAEMDELVGKARGDAEKMQRTSLRGELKRAVQKLRDEVLQVEKPIVVDKQVLFVGGKGDRVVYGDDLRGVVVEVTGKKRYRVEFENGLVMELAASALRADSKPAESGRVLVTVDRPMNVKTEIDLRGERLQEALEKVEKYLVEVHSARLTEVNIIHGKGTMRLSEGIKEYLTAHPMVASHRAGKWGEGDYGVTVVKMK